MDNNLENDERRSPYYGLIFALLVMIIPVVALVFLTYRVCMRFQPQYGEEFNRVTALIMGCGIGTVFHMTFFIAGVFNHHFKIVKNRIKDLFENLTCSVGVALSMYFFDLKTHGVAFWIEFSIFAANIAICVSAILKIMEML